MHPGPYGAVLTKSQGKQDGFKKNVSLRPKAVGMLTPMSVGLYNLTFKPFQTHLLLQLRILSISRIIQLYIQAISKPCVVTMTSFIYIKAKKPEGHVIAFVLRRRIFVLPFLLFVFVTKLRYFAIIVMQITI